MYSSFKHLLKAKAMNENTILVKRLQDWYDVYIENYRSQELDSNSFGNA